VVDEFYQICCPKNRCTDLAGQHGHYDGDECRRVCSALDELTVENAELKDGARYLKKPAAYFAKESLPRYAFMTTL
jgi:hypothetical protein